MRSFVTSSSSKMRGTESFIVPGGGIPDDRRVAWMESMVSASKPTPRMISVEELEELAREINGTCARLSILLNDDPLADRL
jgi:hypothetical protein